MDFVLISWTLQNILEPGKLLQDVNRVLSPGGQLLIINCVLSHISTLDQTGVIESNLEKGRLLPGGIRNLLPKSFTEVNMKSIGGIGQVFGWRLHYIWWNFYRHRIKFVRVAAWSGFPFFLLYTLLMNTFGLIYNSINHSGRYSPAIAIKAKKSF